MLFFRASCDFAAVRLICIAVPIGTARAPDACHTFAPLVASGSRSGSDRRQHGLQALPIEHVAARLAGGFFQPINSNSLKEAIGEAIAMDLGEFNDIKTLPGFSRAAAATLKKAWAAGLKFTELAKTSDALVRSRIDAVSRLEAEVLKGHRKRHQRPSAIQGTRR